MAEHATHPAVAHQMVALDRLMGAVADLQQANKHHARGEHQVAKEVAKQAIGRLQEASAHLAQAQHLHDEAEHERHAGARAQATGDSGAHGASKDKGSHFNANDPGADEGERYGSNADDGEPYAR